jgi:hypothetical protein
MGMTWDDRMTPLLINQWESRTVQRLDFTIQKTYPALRYRADVRKRREEARKEKERLDKESKEPNHEAHEAPDEVPR